MDAGREVAVSTEGLRKHYQLGESHSLGRTVRRLMGRGANAGSDGLEALAGVDVTIWRGESIGIVGTNGSGKSTLLQILAGTTLPTDGVMRIRGRVMALLAVGAVFHVELTGHENVTLFGTSLGIPRRTIAERMDAVAQFADVERHMDTPLKRYSSGMVSRLAFSIAVQFPADIYVFDEVLALVDQEFRGRCIDEIRRLHAAGRTILFVSHSRDQISAVCDRVIWLDRGVQRSTGPTDRVLDAYAEEHGEFTEA